MNDIPDSSKHAPQQNPCLICGSQSFLWGRTVSYGTSEWLYFRPQQGFWGEGEKLWVRQCQSCNNVQLFTKDFSDSK